MADKSSSPLVTVLMPVYNAQLYLGEAIDSILQQTYGNFELLIINDGSTDGSEEIILGYKDSRIKHIKNEQNLKLIATLNKGFSLATGKYIARMDADDYSLNQRLEKQVAFMEANPKVAMAGSWFESLGKNSKIVKYESDVNSIRFKMLYQTQFCHPSVILRKAVTDQLLVLFDPAYVHAEDYELFSRLAYQFKVYNLPEVLLKYRIHSGNVSVLHKKVQVENSIKIRVSNFKAIGVTVTIEEAQLFEELAYQNYDKLIGSLNLIEGLLTKILKASRGNSIISGQFLSDYATQSWFNICYNLIGKEKNINSVFFNSEITKVHLTQFAKLRFRARCLLA
jgi:glycosyltransferase involved in cell wall biosynthesis